MTWTTEKPTAPGWYWVRMNGSAFIEFIQEWGGELGYFDSWEDWNPIRKAIASFAGPIPDPSNVDMEHGKAGY